jgi:flagellar biogenesis protein FliO
VSVILSAVTATTTVTPGAAKAVSVSSLFLQLMVGLAVVLALIWIAARVVRGRVGVNAGRRHSAALAVLGRQPLGKGVQVAIVKAGAETYLLGVTAHQVTRLARYVPDQLDINESSDDLPPAGTPPPGTSPVAFRLQSTIRQLQQRTTRRG